MWGTGVHLSKLAGAIATSDVRAEYQLSSECLYSVQTNGKTLNGRYGLL